MKKANIIFLALICCLTQACNSANDVVFGTEPMKQMAEDKAIQKMSQQDKLTLMAYLTLAEMRASFGGPHLAVQGRTVGEVLKDAKAYRAGASLTLRS